MRIDAFTDFRRRGWLSHLASDSGQKALESAADFVKVTTGLATGALVFSVGLTNAPGGLTTPARYCLGACWIALLVSLVFGVFIAQGRITTKIAKRNYDIHGDRWLTIPTMVHQWTFFVGVALLGATFAVIVGQQLPTNKAKVVSALRAVQIAESKVPSSVLIVKVSAVELVKGIEPGNSSLATWHVQFQVVRLRSDHAPGKSGLSKTVVQREVENSQAKLPALEYLDIFIDPESGQPLAAPQLQVTTPQVHVTYERRIPRRVTAALITLLESISFLSPETESDATPVTCTRNSGGR
jgi:hypothetical protein